MGKILTKRERAKPPIWVDNVVAQDSFSFYYARAMNTGKLVRLNRIFSHPSGRLCSVAVDHFFVYGEGLPEGIRNMKETLRAAVDARPDAVTMHIGMAASVWSEFAGAVPLILQSSLVRPDDSAMELVALPEDAVRMGADAFAVVGFMRGATEAKYLRTIADCVRQAARYEMPVICHIYPRIISETGKGGSYHTEISFAPEDVAWAARCAVEVGVDVVKVPYCGDVKAYSQIVADCPVRLVAAGGPQTKNLQESLGLMADVVKSGAAGATIGRNIWASGNITLATKAFKAVIHDGMKPAEALRSVGL
jgi:class I fructose-bisphosphate aldolase